MIIGLPLAIMINDGEYLTERQEIQQWQDRINESVEERKKYIK